MLKKLKIGILGAGISGLASLKYAIEEGHDVICFERNPDIGGIWSGFGCENGKPASKTGVIYRGLRTNLPKEIMVLSGVEHDNNPKSFIGQPELLKYIKKYTKTFNLSNYISFNHEVISIEPVSNDPRGKWRVDVKNLKTNQVLQYELDALMIAQGRFTNQCIAKIKNADDFQGKVLHSRDYYDAKKFTDQRVLIIGAGPSGIDISNQVSKYASVCYLSRKDKIYKFLPLDKAVVTKTVVDYFDISGAYFKDDSYELIDVVIYCTGYQFKLPYLKPECGLKIEDNSIKYLYHHCINIERPSMAFIGLPYRTSIFPVVDFQARYFMAYIGSRFNLPSKKEMIKSVLKDHELKRSEGLDSCGYHTFIDSGRVLLGKMSEEAGIAPIDKVIFDIMDILHKNWSDQYKYEILDKDTFRRTQIFEKNV